MKMKKYLLLLILPIIFIFAGCKGDELESASKNLNHYQIDIVYNDDHTLTAKQTVTYINKTDTTLSDIMFHLYPRAFRKNASSKVVSTLNHSKCYYNGDSFGDIEITTTRVSGNDTKIEITGNDQDHATVTLSTPLQPDNSIEIYFEYNVTLPNINHRFGYGDDTINLANFYPIACMYENGEWVDDGYHYNGDPFYSDVANYDISINAPSNLKIAHTGNLISSTNIENNRTIHNMNAIVVRDFAIVLSDKFNIVSATIENINVNYYYYNNQYPDECLQASVYALTTFNRLFGKYPYSTLNVVESDFVHGGMEYPNMVMISDMVDVQSDFINVIVHEIAHQWWYGIVGNNEYNYGWLDEGLTEYSTLLFYEENPKYNVDTKELIKNTTNSYITFVEIYSKVFDKVDTTMNRKLNEYSNESEYVYIAYVKGMLIFDNIRELLGKEKFLKGTQEYFKDNKFKIATPDNLINSFEDATGVPIRDLCKSWIDGNVKILPIN